MSESISEPERQQAVQDFAAQFADDPNLLVSITADQHELRVKIQHPLDIDLHSGPEQRQEAVRQAAIDLGHAGDYYWEVVDYFGELQQQGERRALTADDLLLTTKNE